MGRISMTVPDEALLSLRWDADHAGDELRLAAAVKLYEMGRLSDGAAARLAGISRLAFLGRLGEFGVAVFRTTAQELEEDARHASGGE